MSTHRAHIVLPAELIAQIDQAVGPRKRSAFITQVAEAELRRMRLLAFLDESQTNPVMRDEDHPEFAEGSGAWVRKLRAGWQARLDDQEARRDAE